MEKHGLYNEIHSFVTISDVFMGRMFTKPIFKFGFDCRAKPLLMKYACCTD